MNMVEKVARVIFDNAGFPEDWLKLGPDEEFERDKDYYLKQARAAIAAMREPSERMIKACRSFDETCDLSVFSSMIDAALKED